MTKVIFLFSLLLVCSSCIKTIHTSGHLFEEKEIAALKKIQNKEELENLLGSPTTVSEFGQETWYYITSKKESIAFLKENLIEQNIIAVAFKKNGIVDNIIYYSEKDAKHNHEIVSEVTIVKGNDSTTTQQFFGNIGRFNKSKKEDRALPRSGF